MTIQETQPPEFLFVTCRAGAERALKQELDRSWPALRPAFSRPGFLTFRLPADHPLGDDFPIRPVFARAWGVCLGKAEGGTPAERADAVWRLAPRRPLRALHVWQRDGSGPRGWESDATGAVAEADEVLRDRVPADRAESRIGPSGGARVAAGRGQLVLDCVLVEPDAWWVGTHRVQSTPSRWPGGAIPVHLPPHAVSRAYAKMEEALAWSRLPVRRGDRCAEIGAAPGGASQALLEKGLTVIGIDPAEMDPRVVAHPQFRHLRMRGADVRRRTFSDVDWLTADINLPPRYTLEMVESIVVHSRVSLRGLLLTLKLLDWDMAQAIPDWLARIRSWGFRDVRARQLIHNRMEEICVAALRHRSLRRVGRKTQRAT